MSDKTIYKHTTMVDLERLAHNCAKLNDFLQHELKMDVVEAIFTLKTLAKKYEEHIDLQYLNVNEMKVEES